ncbi:MAG: riboflavin biosynthesis protein RibD, partial [Campylobacteraceae bacterium]|nr:riboflavin biosynthesis protein RibD [Campylobacteraceae bacterium]
SYDNGEITSLKSRTFMHNLRDKSELLVIGGKSVIVDKPTLDARLVQGKAPDILIFSNKKDFDRAIPLFNVKNREVAISNDINFPKKYKNIMIEGGSNFLNLLKDRVNWLLIFHNSSFSTIGSLHIRTDLNLKLLHINKIDDEYISWYKIVQK